ncbi:hypothetical protein ACIGO6_09415 [Streptomyces sp. NPDC053750]|uniref:hypothetical protein n=1 Tax=Streptomyces sp. NPDC053750 TaxID=3365714 RepID=UPI0037CFCD44
MPGDPRLSVLSVARLVVSVRTAQLPQARHRRPDEGTAAEESMGSYWSGGRALNSSVTGKPSTAPKSMTSIRRRMKPRAVP